ncbi:SET domain-containing protein [Stemphylium lycopersici]|uniref:SET domain-containing protein n=1 Tax=Stemphylium lycopersici TaxID=183478 RepID=A0A364ND98_STELY|nr:SET domain-containing protein [Stemphylium lycopersici]
MQHFLAQAQAPHQLQQCLEADVDMRLPEAMPSFQHLVWSHEPVCIKGKEKDYCTHTSANLRSGHGLSIIATPVAADKIVAAFLARTTGLQHMDYSLEVRSVPGKGKGLFTTKPIKKGETILLDPARIIASSQFPTQVSRSQGQSLFGTASDQLPEEDRRVVSALDQSLGGSKTEDIMKTNAFACQLADGKVYDAYMCLFPYVARINHACQPNAHARFVPTTLSMEVKARRDVTVGEEINISYGSIDLKYSERQKLYRNGWNFACTCPLCKAPQHEIQQSDQRRDRFAQLRSMLENLTAETYNAQQIVAWEKEVMAIAHSEGLELLLAPDYERLAYVYAGHGMRKDARLWAEKAKESLLEWVVVDGGPGNEARRVDNLLRELQ